MGEGLAVLALVLFSCNAFVVRAAAARLEQGLGFLVALVANVAAAGLLVLIQIVVAGPLATPPWTAVVLFVLGGVLANYLGRRGYFRSVELLGPSRAAAVQVSNPAFALAFAWGFLQETVTRADLAAIGAVLLGLLLASLKPGPTPGTGSSGMVPLAHVAPAVFAAMSYGAGNVVRGAAVRQWEEPLVGGLLGALSGTLVYVLLHVPVRAVLADVRRADRRGLLLWWVAGVAAVGGQIAVIGATARIPVGIAVAISSALPIIVIPVSVVVLRNRERVTWATVTGSVLVLAGVTVMLLT